MSVTDDPKTLGRTRLSFASEADIEIREQQLEQREAAVGELEQKLFKKETDLQTYVGQLQTELTERETDWWTKQLGHDAGADKPASGLKLIS